MKTSSDTKPADQVKSNDKTQVNYNKQEVEIADEAGKRRIWVYDYVEITGRVTNAKVIAAMEAESTEADISTWTPDKVAAEIKSRKKARSDLELSHSVPVTISSLRQRVDLIEKMLGIQTVEK